MREGRRLLHDILTMASHTNHSNDPSRRPVISPLDDAVILKQPGGQHAHHARATYTTGTQTVSAELIFDDTGKLMDFVSDDRYRTSEDGTTATRARWNTPISKYRTMHGHPVASYGEGMWAAPAPEGHFTYIEFHIDDVNYNVTAGRSHQTHPQPLATASAGP
jgi:hypothetical protein